MAPDDISNYILLEYHNLRSFLIKSYSRYPDFVTYSSHISYYCLLIFFIQLYIFNQNYKVNLFAISYIDYKLNTEKHILNA